MNRHVCILIFLLLGGLFAADMESILYDDTMLKLEGELKETVRRQGIIAHNIANAEIEGYQPIRFADELKEIKSRPGFEKDEVVIEEEMAKMTKNRLRHQTYMKLYNMKLQVLKKVISQGK